GTSGVQTTNVSGTSGDSIYAIAMQPDRKLVVAGQVNSDSLVARYNTDGTLDTSFDTDGIVTVALAAADADFLRGVAVLPSGKILSAGSVRSGSYYILGLARLDSDGSLDTSFDTDGIVTTSVHTYSDHVNAMAVQPDGKILLGGYYSNGTNDDFV